MIKNQKKNKKGFTLIELLVSVFVFSLIVVAVSGLFISGLKSQKGALASQKILNQMSYALEYMSRALRMARKQTADVPPCLSQNGLNYEITTVESGISGLKFINHLENDDCQAFFLQDGLLKIKRKIGQPDEEILNLTSNDLDIAYLVFGPSDSPHQGWSQDDDVQPRVTIYLDARGKAKGLKEQPEIKIETTVSQRSLDVKY